MSGDEVSGSGSRRWRSPDVAEVALTIGRFGWVAKGVVYSVFGLLAIGLVVAIGDPSSPSGGGDARPADQAGALEAIRDRAFGAVMLGVVAVGLVVYSCWRWYTTFSRRLDADLAHRLGYGFSAAWYLALAWGAAETLSGGGGGDSDLVEDLSDRLLGSVWGSILVALAGVVAVVAGVVFARRAIHSEEPGDHDPDAIEPWPDWAERIVEVMGRIGWGGRAALTFAVGGIALAAAVDPDIDSAEGFDGALRSFSARAWGDWAVGLTGAALVVYGLYCIVTAAVRRPDE